MSRVLFGLHIKSIIVTFLALFSSASSAYFSNDPHGDMFISRPFADISNCGPLSALMLTKYVKQTKYRNIQDEIDKARMLVQKQPENKINYRWWSFGDIKKFLSNKKVNYREISTNYRETDTKKFHHSQIRASKILHAIVDGNVVVVNIDMNDLKKNAEIGKYYDTTGLFGRWGHFLIIVGYKKVNGRLAYEIHDSYSTRGKNRFFYAKDINNAIAKYNKNLLLVPKDDQSDEDIFSVFFQ